MKSQMRRTVLMVFVISMVCNSSVFSQTFDSYANAIRTGNAATLAAGFGSTVEITIKTTGNSYSKSQAEMMLKNFFTTHQPKSFSIVHQGTSPEGSKYFIGNLVTSAGSYRTYLYAKTVNGVLLIQEMRFETQ